jgi:hypothetical protein
MSFEVARAVADAVLFEGYVLYPYRASAPKNQVRWQFGVLAPPGAEPSETTFAQTECLIEPGVTPTLELRARFLQVQARDGDPPWDEGVVREVDARAVLEPGTAHQVPFELPGETGGGRRSWPLSGLVRVATDPVPGSRDLFRVRVRVENHTDWAGGQRPRMLRRSLIAAHTLLAVEDGRFLSLLDPPGWAADAVAGCRNLHTWPVLVGQHTMLSSPIILYDHPEIAPESTADLCDATEIDELLLLRTMTLTDEEKRQARATDPRAAAIVDHADTIPAEIFERLHGAIRSIRPASRPAAGPAEDAFTDAATDPFMDAFMDPFTDAATDPFMEPFMEPAAPWWDPGADRSVSPETDGVEVAGGIASRGVRVRIRRGRRRSDAQDMFLHGRTATVAAVLHNVEGGTHLAVTIDDDPAADLNASTGRFLYFAPDEVELL